MSEDKCKRKLVTKSAHLGSINDEELDFDLHVYTNNEYFEDEKPIVLYLFDGPFDSDLLTNITHPWVQFSRDAKAKLIGVELRGRGGSVIEGHDPSSDSSLFTVEHHLDDLFSVFEFTNYEFGPQPWLIVGREKAAELAIWNRLKEEQVFVAAYAIEPDLSKLTELSGKAFGDYKPSNLILSASTEKQLNEYKKFVDKFHPEENNLIVLQENESEKIVDAMKNIVLDS